MSCHKPVFRFEAVMTTVMLPWTFTECLLGAESVLIIGFVSVVISLNCFGSGIRQVLLLAI